MKRYLGIFLPSTISVVLFGATVFWLVLPQTESAIMAQKKTMISELTLSVCSMLATYSQQEEIGALTRRQAQQRALARLGQMRYGPDNKDYFWVTDLKPRMLMHPYRPELDGQDLTQYVDSHGKRFFWEYTRMVEKSGQGFVSYMWQWKDDASQEVPKTSHVRLFKPWGWVVGTGMYTDDVAREMAIMTRNLTLAGAMVMALVSLLAGFITMRNIKVDRERQRAQESLIESEQRFRGISDNALDGIVMIDPEGQISFWNQAAEKIFGYAASEVMGADLHRILAPPAYHQDYLDAFAKFQEIGQGYAIGKILELTALRKNGEEFPIELSVAALHLRGRRHAVGVIRDITQRKQAEIFLQQSEEKFRRLFHASPVMMTISTLDEGRMLEVSDTVLTEFGFTRQEVIGKTVQELGVYWDPGQRHKMIENFQKTSKSARQETTMRRKDGSPIEMLLLADDISYDGRQCLLNVMLDITETKRAQREKQQLEDRLQQSQKMEAIGTLAGGIAHDFNNILSAVLGFSEMAMMLLPQEEKPYLYVSQVYSAGLRARDLVQQILAFSRQTKVDKYPVEVRLLVKESLKMLRATIPATVSIVSEIEDTTDEVLADPSQIHQVMLNLCTNAAHAMEGAGGALTVGLTEEQVTPDPSLGPDQPSPGVYLALTVQDTGIGMSPETMERIFDPFFTTKAKGKGTGLGLSVVHGIVTDLGGWMSVQSVAGEGATFKVLLPRYEGKETQDAAAPQELPTGNEHILVVDDEDFVAQSHRLMLESLGYRVTVCNNASKAWELLSHERADYQLLITDLAMPLMDGISLVRKVRQEGEHIAALLATGYVDEKKVTPQLLKELGIGKVLHKPLILVELAHDVRQALDQNQMPPEG